MQWSIWSRFNKGLFFSADDVGTGAGAPSAEPQGDGAKPEQTPADTSQGVQQTDVRDGLTAPQGGDVSPASPPVSPSPEAQAQEQAPQGLMEWLKASGQADLASRFKDEKELVQALLGERERLSGQMQQMASLAQLGQKVQPHWAQVSSFLEQQQAQQPKPWWSDYWSPPEYDPNWLSQVRYNEDGSVSSSTPQDILNKLQAYQAYQQQKMNQFFQNPFTFLEEPVKHLARQVAEELVQDKLGSARDETYANEFIRDNSYWLFDFDPATKQPRYTQVLDPQTGQYRQQRSLSPAGRTFYGHLQSLNEMGLPLQQQQELALKLTERDVLAAQRQQSAGQAAESPASAGQPAQQPQAQVPQTPEQQNQQIKDQFVQSQAQKRANFGGGQPVPTSQPVDPAATPRKDFWQWAQDVAREQGVALGS